MKGKCTSSGDRRQLYYLRMQILKKIKEDEKHLKKEVFDIDLAIDIDTQFLLYKRQLHETTILLDRFWLELSKKDYQVEELIGIGRGVVEGYLQTKGTFDYIVDKRHDFKELVQLHMHFHFDVMCFEMEALNYQNMLKSIQ